MHIVTIRHHPANLHHLHGAPAVITHLQTLTFLTGSIQASLTLHICTKTFFFFEFLNIREQILDVDNLERINKKHDVNLKTNMLLY